GWSVRKDRGFGVGEFLVAALVAAFVDEFLGSSEIGLRANPFLRIFLLAAEEAGAVEVDVGQEKPHGAALGDFPGFVQIFLRAGKETGGFLLIATRLLRRLVLRSLGEDGSFSEGTPGTGEEATGKLVHIPGA